MEVFFGKQIGSQSYRIWTDRWYRISNEQYMKTLQTFKDKYFLNYINTEELDLADSQDLEERVLEKEFIIFKNN